MMGNLADLKFMVLSAARLAYQQLTHRGKKLVGALLGVVVAIVLMFTQLGFKGALYDSGVAVARDFAGEIVMTAPEFKTMSFNPPWMSREELFVARSVAGVLSASPLYASTVQVANPAGGNFLTTWLYAFAPDQPVFTLEDVNQAIPLIRLSGNAIIDRQSRYELGDIAAKFKRSGSLDLVLPSPTAMTQFTFTIVGSFSVGPTISADGNLITSDLNYYRYLHVPLDRVSMGIVRLADGRDPVAVQHAIEKKVGSNARVFLKQDFIENEIDFYAYHTPIGIIFNVGLAVGVFVGIVFISQTLHSIINDSIREYAVLRAIGYTQSFFMSLVTFVAIAIALTAYFPSILLTVVIYKFAAAMTKLPLVLKTQYLVYVLLVVIGMSLTAALLSTKQLKKADPVDLF